MDDLLSLKWKNHSSTFLQILGLIRKDNTYSDVTLTCSGRFYSAHKMVLTACSDYFREIFQHTDCKKPVIVLKGISCRELEVLLDYMYIGEVNVKQSDITSLIKAAECLQIKGLAEPDEPPKQSKRSYSSPSPKNKRKFTSSQHSSEPKHFKADTTLYSISDNKDYMRSKHCDDELPLIIKEEIIDDFASDKANAPFLETESNLPDETINTQSYNLSQLSNLEAQPGQSVSSNNQSSPAYQNTEWTGESEMDYSSFIDGEDGSNHNRFDKVRSSNCNICWKIFGSPAELARHIRIHTGEKPFACPHCDYKSAQKGNLKKHVLCCHLEMEPK